MLPKVKVSKYCDGVNGSMDCFEIGDKAVIKNADHPENNGLVVIIDSELMHHDDAPYPGLVYEVIFSNGYGRAAVSADKLYPIIEAA